MRRREIFTAGVAILMAGAGSAFGQPRGDRDGRGRNEQPQRDGWQDRRRYGPGRYDRRPDQGRMYRNQPRYDRGAGPNHSFHPGQRLPLEYRRRQYVVEDWRGHGLRAPPRGYYWVQTGADYVLVAIATGIILQLMLNN